MNEEVFDAPRRQWRQETGQEHQTDVAPVDFLQEKRARQQRYRSLIRRGVFILAIFFVIFASAKLVGGFVFTQPAPEAYDPITLEPKKPAGFFQKIGYSFFSKEPQLAGQRDDRINLLLLGMAGEGNDGPYLTDTIILASIKPSTENVALLSIPRDLGVKIPERGWYKINHANAFGELKGAGEGARLTRAVIEDTFAVEIPYYVRIDFTAFQELIDIVGGITINVARGFTDTQYPASDGGYQTVSFPAGAQTMTGDQALIYARSRHGNNNEGSDFARARRQQQVLLALKEKILSFQTLANPVRLNSILNSLDQHVATNLEFSDLIALVKMARSFEQARLATVVLDTSEKGYLEDSLTEDGAYVLLPKTGNFDEIKQLIKHIFATTAAPLSIPAQTTPPPLTDADIEIQNGTWRAGLAARVRQELRHAGIKVASIGNTAARPIAASGIYTVSGIIAPDILDTLTQTLKVPAKENLPAGEGATSTTDILVILGEDYVE